VSGQERPPLPEPLPCPVVDNHCHLDIGHPDIGHPDIGHPDIGHPDIGHPDIGDGDNWLSPEEALKRSAAVGVPRIVQIGCDLPGALWAAELADRLDPIVAGVAIHPNEAPRLNADGFAGLDAALAVIERLARSSERVRAVGETGLDFFRTGPEGVAAQKHSFRAHIRLAHDLDKTLVVHDRDAHDDVLAMLDEHVTPERTVMHCFSGEAEFARACLDRGCYLSFAGTVTFKNAQNIRDALAIAPLDRILVETDAPFLAPTPYRGRPNASYLIPVTVRAMAQIRGDDLATLCAAIADNTDRAFGGSW
jgi:TatD DNase family protein